MRLNVVLRACAPGGSVCNWPVAVNTADVYVSERFFDVEGLKAGDMVMVDFFVQDDNEDRLEAARIEKLEPAQ